jgi:hypothetical protein
MNDWFAAVFHRRRLAELRPHESQNLMLLYRDLMNLGQGIQALQFCTDLLSRQPSLAPAYLARARLRLALGDKIGSNADVLSSLSVASQNLAGWPELANMEKAAGYAAARTGDWEGAQALRSGGPVACLGPQAPAELRGGRVDPGQRRGLSKDLCDLAPDGPC